MLKLLKESLTDIRKVHKQIFSFQIIFFFLTGFAFVPMITVVFNRTLKSLGYSVLLNHDIYKLGYNYRGIVGILVIAVLSVIAIFIELGMLIIIAQKQYFDKNITLTDAFVTMVIKIPKIFGLGLIQIVFFLIVLIPVVDAPMASSLLESMNIPLLVRLQIMESEGLRIIYILGLIFSSYLVLRWIFTLHYIIIENKPSRRAIMSSQRLTRKNEIKIILALFLFNLIIFGVGIGLISRINVIPSMIKDTVQSDLLEKYLMTLSGYLTYGFTLFILPVNVLWITRLFYRFQQQVGETIEDHLFMPHLKLFNKLERVINDYIGPRRYLILAIFTVYLTVTFILNYSVTEDILRWNVEIVAHRGGDKSLPENSMKAILDSLEKGISIIEIDIQMTKDDVIVLNHDVTLSRVAGVKSKVKELTFEELELLDIGMGEHIPTLEAVLMAVKDKARLIIEIKTFSSTQEMIQQLVELIQEQDMVEQCMIHSFSYEVLKEVRKLDSSILIGQVLYASAGNLDQLDVDFYTIKEIMLSDSFIKAAHEKGRSVWVWTVNKETSIKEVLKYDIDGIITGYPGKVAEFMGQ